MLLLSIDSVSVQDTKLDNWLKIFLFEVADVLFSPCAISVRRCSVPRNTGRMSILVLRFDSCEVPDSVFEFQIAQDSVLAPTGGANVALGLLEADIVVL